MQKTIKIIAVLSLLVLVDIKDGLAFSRAGSVKKGNLLFEQKNYDAALDLYDKLLKKDEESDVLNYNMGTVYYKKGDYKKAVEHLQKSFLSENKTLKKNAYYNTGNALYKFGVGHENDDLNLAISSLEKSIGQYEQVLQSDPTFEDAKFNYDFVKKELERLKKKQQEQSKQCPRPDKQENKKDNQPSKDDKSQSQPQNQQNSEKQQEDKATVEQQKPEDTGDSQDTKDKEPSQPSDRSEKEHTGFSDSQDQRNGSGDEVNKTPIGQEGSAISGKLSKEEAEMLLNDYQQNQEPQGLLNSLQLKRKEIQVKKDW